MLNNIFGLLLENMKGYEIKSICGYFRLQRNRYDAQGCCGRHFV